MVPQQLDFSSLCDFSWLNKMFCCQKKKKKGSVRGVQTFCWRGVFQPKSSLPVEVHGRLLAVLCTVASGPTVVTGQIPTLFVTGAIAAAH